MNIIMIFEKSERKALDGEDIGAYAICRMRSFSTYRFFMNYIQWVYSK